MNAQPIRIVFVCLFTMGVKSYKYYVGYWLEQPSAVPQTAQGYHGVTLFSIELFQISSYTVSRSQI